MRYCRGEERGGAWRGRNRKERTGELGSKEGGKRGTKSTGEVKTGSKRERRRGVSLSDNPST